MTLNFGYDEEGDLFGKRRYGGAGLDVGKGRGRGFTAVVSVEGKGDYEDIQAAIDDLPYTHVGGRIYIDDGTYYISSTITIDRDDLELVFSSKALVKRKVDGAFNLFKLGDGTTRRQNITIRGLKIDDIAGSAASNGIELDFVKNVKIVDCTIENTHDAPIIVDASSDYVWLLNCHTDKEFTIAGNNVVMANAQHAGNIVISGDDVTITGCNFKPTSFTIDESASTRLIFIGNTIETGMDDHIFLTGTDGTFIGNINKARTTWDWDYSGATRCLFIDYDNISGETFTAANHTAIGNGAPHHAESHNVASHSDTTGTGAELNTLTDDSMADALHRHSELSASDGTPNPAVHCDANGNLIGDSTTGTFVIPSLTQAQINALGGINGRIVYNSDEGYMFMYVSGAWEEIGVAAPIFTAAMHTAIGNGAPHHAESHNAASHSDITKTGAQIDAAVTASHAASHSVASHSDTTITGAETETLSNNSMADALHRHSELSASDGTPDKAWFVDATGNLQSSVGGQAFIIPAVTDAQFGNLAGTRGTIVYNNEEGALMYSDGDSWYIIDSTWFGDV